MGYSLFYIFSQIRCTKHALYSFAKNGALILLLLAIPVYSYAFSFNHPLVDAADEQDMPEVQRLLRAGISANSRGDYDVTPMMRAVYQNNRDIAELLLTKGADLDATDTGGATALHLAVRQRNDEMVRFLLRAGANPNLRDFQGWTPLMRAVLLGEKAIVHTLLQANADTTIENIHVESAFDIAIAQHHDRIFEMLLHSNVSNDYLKRLYGSLDSGSNQAYRAQVESALLTRASTVEPTPAKKSSADERVDTPSFVLHSESSSSKAAPPTIDDIISENRKEVQPPDLAAPALGTPLPDIDIVSLNELYLVEEPYYAVELTSATSAKRLFTEAEIMWQQASDTLKPYPFYMLATNNKSGLLYKLLTRPFARKAHADALCSALQNQQIGCEVVIQERIPRIYQEKLASFKLFDAKHSMPDEKLHVIERQSIRPDYIPTPSEKPSIVRRHATESKGSSPENNQTTDTKKAPATMPTQAPTPPVVPNNPIPAAPATPPSPPKAMETPPATAAAPTTAPETPKAAEQKAPDESQYNPDEPLDIAPNTPEDTEEEDPLNSLFLNEEPTLLEQEQGEAKEPAPNTPSIPDITPPAAPNSDLPAAATPDISKDTSNEEKKETPKEAVSPTDIPEPEPDASLFLDTPDAGLDSAIDQLIDSATDKTGAETAANLPPAPEEALDNAAPPTEADSSSSDTANTATMDEEIPIEEAPVPPADEMPQDIPEDIDEAFEQQEVPDTTAPDALLDILPSDTLPEENEADEIGNAGQDTSIPPAIPLPPGMSSEDKSEQSDSSNTTEGWLDKTKKFFSKETVKKWVDKFSTNKGDAPKEEDPTLQWLKNSGKNNSTADNVPQPEPVSPPPAEEDWSAEEAPSVETPSADGEPAPDAENGEDLLPPEPNELPVTHPDAETGIEPEPESKTIEAPNTETFDEESFNPFDAPEDDSALPSAEDHSDADHSDSGTIDHDANPSDADNTANEDQEKTEEENKDNNIPPPPGDENSTDTDDEAAPPPPGAMLDLDLAPDADHLAELKPAARAAVNESAGNTGANNNAFFNNDSSTTTNTHQFWITVGNFSSKQRAETYSKRASQYQSRIASSAAANIEVSEHAANDFSIDIGPLQALSSAISLCRKIRGDRYFCHITRE